MRPSSVLKRGILAMLLILLVIMSTWPFRDSLSLLFWRVRYISTPRATGSGARVIFPAGEPSKIGVKLAGISEKEWRVSHVWVPSTQSLMLSSRNTIITLGCWWNHAGPIAALSSDSAGTFSNALVRSVGLAHAPVQNQIACQTRAAAGQHVITPPRIGPRGDGFFLVLEAEGIDANAPIRDSGQSRQSHPFFGDGDPDTIESISVSTDGTAARVGDLAVALFSMDPCDNPNINIDLPAGWTSLGFNHVALLNLGYRACCKMVTDPGRQSATCTWSDDSTFVAEATMVIFKGSGTTSE